MIGFFRVFGQGILYVVLSPLIIAFFALYVVFSLLMFIFQLFKNLIWFFMGRNLKDGFLEDIEAKKRMENLAFNPNTGAYQDKSKLEQLNNQQPIINATNLQVNNINTSQDMNNANLSNPFNNQTQINNLDVPHETKQISNDSQENTPNIIDRTGDDKL